MIKPAGCAAWGLSPRVKAAAYLFKRLVLGGESQRFAPAGTLAFRPEAPAEEGVLDGVIDHVVRGWARRIDQPEQITAVDLYLQDDYLGRAFCDVARKDLAGLPGFAAQGRNAFVFPLPAHARRLGGRLRAVAASSGLELAGSPADLPGELTVVPPEEVRELLARGWYTPAAVAATSLAQIQHAYGRRLAVLTEPDPQAFDARWPVTLTMSHVNARVHDGALGFHGAKAYAELLYRAAEHLAPARAGLPMDLAQVQALTAPTGWLLDGHVRSHLLLDLFLGREGPSGVQDDAAAAEVLTRFAVQELASRRLPVELLGESARAFLRQPALDGRRSRFEQAFARSPLFAHLPSTASPALAAAAVRAAAADRGLAELTLGGMPTSNRAAAQPAEAGVRILSADYGASGLSLNARHSLAALIANGVDTETTRAPVSPETPASAYDALVHPAYATALIHATPEDAVEIILRLPPEQAHARLIGFFMWETEVLPARQRLGSRLVDEIWTASRFCADIYRAAAPSTSVHIVGHAVDPPDPDPGFDARAWAGVGPDSFMFLFHFDAHSWISRKNPIGAIRAFRRAFPIAENGVQLVIKVRKSEDAGLAMWADWWAEFYEEAGQDPRLVVAHADLTGRQMASLTASADAFVSLHRAEGFGYALAEAMLAGKPLVTTAYSGNLDFTLPDETLLVPAIVRPIRPREFLHSGPQQRWGEPDLDAAAAALRRLYDDRGLAQRLGALGRERVLQDCSIARLAANYARRLGPSYGVHAG